MSKSAYQNDSHIKNEIETKSLLNGTYFKSQKILNFYFVQKIR